MAEIIDFEKARWAKSQAEAQRVLQVSSIETLLATAYQITHRMHAADREQHDFLRAQRDMISNEIIRRTKGQRK